MPKSKSKSHRPSGAERLKRSQDQSEEHSHLHPTDLITWDATLVLTAGVDEAGRGPWVGPVVAAAVILDPHQEVRGLNDSKKLKPQVRARLSEEIRAKALCFAIGQASVEEIDRLNILQATLLAMRRAVDGLQPEPLQVLVDGNRLPTLRQRAFALVGGDTRVPSIQAASILAKVHRDAWCDALDQEYPGYGFAAHKGYGTAEHQDALERLGVTPWHRLSFAPVAKRLALGPNPHLAQGLQAHRLHPSLEPRLAPLQPARKVSPLP